MKIRSPSATSTTARSCARSSTSRSCPPHNPPHGLDAYAPWLLLRATDYLRGDVAVKGGITTLVKAAHLAEAFGLKFEVHHGGNSLNNVANLHVLAAINNADYFEVLLPDAAHRYGCYYGVDNVKGGQKQADIMNKLLDGKTGNVWNLSGLASAPNLQDRLRGVKMNLNKNLTIAGTTFCDEDVAKGVTETENVLRSHPDLIGFIIVGTWPLLASPGALPRMTARAKAAAQGGRLRLRRAGTAVHPKRTVYATVGQDYWGWGYQSVQILYNLIKGKKYPYFVPRIFPWSISPTLPTTSKSGRTRTPSRVRSRRSASRPCSRWHNDACKPRTISRRTSSSAATPAKAVGATANRSWCIAATPTSGTSSATVSRSSTCGSASTSS
jgi:Periplasmic binding protein domain/Enolase C-terminal domain-like